MDKQIENEIVKKNAPNRRRYLAVIAVLSALIVIVFALKKFDLLPSKKKPPVDNNTAAQGERVSVNAYKVSRVNYEDNLNVLGNVEGGVQVDLHFEKEGRIAKINYKEGDFVKENAVIAELDAREAQLKVDQAGIDYDQHKKLYDAGVIIKAKLDQAAVAYQQAKVEYGKMILLAPFDGVVSNIEQKEGEVVNQSKKIVSLFNTSQMVIKIGITENDISKLFMEQSALVTFDAISNAGYTGKVVGIDPNIDETTRMMTLKVSVDNEEALILPGMFARVKIKIYSEENALVVPSAALVKTEDKYKIYVVGEGNVITVREAEVSYVSLDYTSVSKGITEGEIVVLDKTDKLNDGSVVELLNVEEYTTHTPGKR